MTRTRLYLLDFEVERGKQAIALYDVKKCFDFFKDSALQPQRIYLLLLWLGLRPAEPMQLKWSDFVGNQLYFRPEKQKKRGVLRVIKIPPKILNELIQYRDRFLYKDGPLFNFTHEAFRRRFNGEFRHKIGGRWGEKSNCLRGGMVAQYYKYVLSGFRTTNATLLYYICSLVEGDGNIALERVCEYMGHSSEKMTARYYIKRREQLGTIPLMPFTELLDHVIFKDGQECLKKYTQKEQQHILIEY